jgi:hypothetical protein
MNNPQHPLQFLWRSLINLADPAISDMNISSNKIQIAPETLNREFYGTRYSIWQVEGFMCASLMNLVRVEPSLGRSCSPANYLTVFQCI